MFKKFYFIFFIFIFIISIIYSTNNNSNLYYIYPTESKIISSEYGYREIFGSISFHDGIDFPLIPGSNVYASNSGTVSFVGFLNGYGNSVILLHDDGYKTLYGHLDSNFLVKQGEYIRQNELVAKVGPKYLENGMLNGFTTGPHLHFSIFDINGKSKNPLEYINNSL